MPKIKREDCACDVPGLGHFDPGDEMEVGAHTADQFRGAVGWSVTDDPEPVTTTTTDEVEEE